MNTATKTEQRQYIQVPLARIIPSQTETQARRRAHFTKEEIADLSQSIKANGLIQPITVRPAPGFTIVEGKETQNGKTVKGFFWQHAENLIVGQFSKNRKELEENSPLEIVCGERRYLAVHSAGISSIEAIIRDLTDAQVLDIQLIENLQRKEIDPIDEAFSFKKLLGLGQYSVADLSARIGRPEKYIKLRLRLNELIPEVLDHLSKGWLPLGHAMEIAKFSPDVQREIHENNDAYDYRYEDEEPSPQTLSAFKETLKNCYILSLSKAGFDLNDTRLHPDGLACSACSERTGFEPSLFEDHVKDGDSCLNQKCFDAKKVMFYQITRENAAKSLKMKPEEIPYASEQGYYSRYLPDEAQVLSWVSIIDSNECGNASPVINLSSEAPGTIGYICSNEKCKQHRTENKNSLNDGYKAERLYREFMVEVANTVQEKILIESAAFFENRTFWADKALMQDLLCGLFNKSLYYGSSLLSSWDKHLAKLLKDSENEVTDEIRSYISEFDTVKLSQLIFLLLYHAHSRSRWDIANPADILEINDRYAALNYKLIEAEAIVKLAPKEFQTQAKTYLKAIQSGIDAEKPQFWLDKVKI